MAVHKPEPAEAEQPDTEEHPYIAIQRRLMEAGLIHEIKPLITDHTPYENRKLIQSRGRPLSEILIEERR